VRVLGQERLGLTQARDGRKIDGGDDAHQRVKVVHGLEVLGDRDELGKDLGAGLGLGWQQDHRRDPESQFVLPSDQCSHVLRAMP